MMLKNQCDKSWSKHVYDLKSLVYNETKKFIFDNTVFKIHIGSSTYWLHCIISDTHLDNIDNSDYDCESSSVDFSKLCVQTLIWMTISSHRMSMILTVFLFKSDQQFAKHLDFLHLEISSWSMTIGPKIEKRLVV